ncbi:hypothetical protein DB345_05875 [Spartobacteria bacterium LR76]|nr:hypothetical protein DB345_05875 [Spartobacteria bacterium LR76]
MGGRGFALVIAMAAIVLITVIVLAFFSRALLNRQVSFTSTNQIKSDMLARMAMDVVVGEIRQEIIDYSNPATNGVYRPLASSNMVPAQVGVTGADSNGAMVIAKISGATNRIDPGVNGKTFGSTVRIDAKGRNGRMLSQWFANGPQLGTADLPTWTYLTRSGTIVQSLGAGNNIPSATNAVVGRFSYTVYNIGGLLDANVAGYPSTFPAAKYQTKESISYADLTALGLSTQQIDALIAWRNKKTGSSEALFEAWATGKASTNASDILAAARIGSEGHLGTVIGDNSFLSRSDLLRYLNRTGMTNAAPNLVHRLRSATAPSYGPTNLPTDSGGVAPYGDKADDPASYNRSLPGVKAFDGVIWHYHDDGTWDSEAVTANSPLVRRPFSLARLAWLGHDGPNVAAFDPSLSASDRERAIKTCFGLKWNDAKHRWDYDHGDEHGILSLDQVRNLKRGPDFFELLRAGIMEGSLGTNPGDPTSATDISVPVEGVLGDIKQIANKKDRQILQIGANIIDQADADNYPTAIYQMSNQEISPDDELYNYVFGVENLPVLTRVGLINHYWPDHGSGTTPAPTGPGDMRVFLQPEVWNPHDSSTADPAAYPDTPSQLRFVTYGGASLRLDESGSNVPTTSQMGSNPVVMSFGRDPAAPSARGMIGFNNPPPTSTAPLSFFSKPVPLTGYCSAGSPGSAMNNPLLDYAVNVSLYDANNRYKSNATKTQFDTFVERTPYLGVYLGTLTRTIPATGTSQHSVSVIPDLAEGGYLSFALEYEDKNGQWLPYSVISRVRAMNKNGWSTGSKYGGYWGSIIARVDPRTDRFSVSSSMVRPNTPSWQMGYSIRTSVESTYDDGNNIGRGVISSAWPRASAGFVNAAGGKCMFDAWMQNIASSDFRYSDLDNITRPGDAFRASATGDTSGDGMGTYMLTSGTSDYLPGSKARRRPYILNRAFQSVGELGYVFRDQPFKTLDLWSDKSADAALLDLFSVSDQAMVAAGKVNINSTTESVVEAILRNVTKQVNNVAGSALTANEATALAREAVGEIRTNGALRDASAISSRLGGVFNTAATSVNGNNTPLNQPFRNKSYGEAPIRALADVADIRTWNLLVDVVAQSGRLAVNATGLQDFIVEGERRYWLHVSVDRITGKLVSAQMEPVYE